jgi:DNA-binding response OmpR family regulator
MPSVQKNILIVEDNRDLAVLLAERVGSYGFTVSSAYDGKAGLEAAKASKPDLILLDLMMPKMDGRAVIMELKLDESTRSIPIIVLTAVGDSYNREFTIELGASDYVTKPVEPAILLKKIKDLLI